MERTDFVSLKKLKSLTGIVHRKFNTNKEPVDFMKINWIRVTKAKPFMFSYRYTPNELEAWKPVDLARRSKRRPVDIRRVPC